MFTVVICLLSYVTALTRDRFVSSMLIVTDDDNAVLLRNRLIITQM